MADNGNSSEGQHVRGKERVRKSNSVTFNRYDSDNPSILPSYRFFVAREQPIPRPDLVEDTIHRYRSSEDAGAATPSVSSGFPTSHSTTHVSVDAARVFVTFGLAAVLRATAEARLTIEHTKHYGQTLGHYAFIASRLSDAIRDKDMEKIKDCSEALSLIPPQDPPELFNGVSKSDLYMKSVLPQLLSGISGWDEYVNKVQGHEGMVDLQKAIEHYSRNPLNLGELVVDKLPMQSLAEREKELDQHIAKYFTLDYEESQTPLRPSAPISGSSQHVRRRNSM